MSATTILFVLIFHLQLKASNESIKQLLRNAHALLEKNYPDSALGIAEYAMQISKEKGFDDSLGMAHYTIGGIYKFKGNKLGAESHLRQAVEIADIEGNVDMQSKAHSAYGTLLMDQDEYKKAEYSLEKALSYAKRLNDSNLLRMSHNNLGSLRLIQGRHEDALFLYFKALKVSEGSRYETGKAVALQNVGYCYYKLGRLDEAEKNIREAYDLCIQLGQKYYAAKCLRILSSIQVAQGKISEGNETFRRYLNWRTPKGKLIDPSGFRYADEFLADVDSAYSRRMESGAIEAASEDSGNAWNWFLSIISILLLGLSSYLFQQLQKTRKALASSEDSKSISSDPPGEPKEKGATEKVSSLDDIRKALNPIYEDEKWKVLIGIYGFSYGGLAPKEIASQTEAGLSTVYKHMKLIRKLLDIEDIRSHAIDIGIPLLSESERSDLFSGVTD